MQIVVNGRLKDQPDGITVARLLESLSLEPRRVAVEHNKEIVPRARYGQTQLAEKDQLEIVTLVGGG
ncbi:MAG: sulfur carrier protein ThiS [Phycisphaerae bacterium]|nr:sulfur carrier protein ThiS [Phycisphaerae bacterium]